MIKYNFANGFAIYADSAIALLQGKFNFDDAAMALFGSIYIGYGFKYFLLIRIEGLRLLLLALFIVWATDIGAYLIGRKLGKHKLAPHISPNKTIGGAVGGLIMAIIVGVIFQLIYPFEFSLFTVILYALLISIVGQVGDLVASAFKRHYKIKDAGKLFPGHGGVLDRLDSLIFVLLVLSIIQFV